MGNAGPRALEAVPPHYRHRYAVGGRGQLWCCRVLSFGFRLSHLARNFVSSGSLPPELGGLRWGGMRLHLQLFPNKGLSVAGVFRFTGLSRLPTGLANAQSYGAALPHRSLGYLGVHGQLGGHRVLSFDAGSYRGGQIFSTCAQAHLPTVSVNCVSPGHLACNPSCEARASLVVAHSRCQPFHLGLPSSRSQIG